MSGGSRKRILDDDPSHSGYNEKAKMHKDDGQPLRETDSFQFVDDVILELISMADGVSSSRGGQFLHILQKLEKSDILVRKKQARDFLPALRYGDMEELLSLVDVTFPEVYCTKPEEQLEKVGSDNRLVERQTNHKQNSNSVLETNDEPPQLEAHFSQVNAQPPDLLEEEDQVIESKPDMHNLCAGDDGYVSSAAKPEEAPEFSNQTMNVAQINFNAELLKKIDQLFTKGGNTVDVNELCRMIERRTTIIKHRQYEYNLADQQKFNQEMLMKLRSFKKEAALNVGQPLGNANMNIIFQELVDMLQADAQNSTQFVFPFFRYLTDFDLLKCILNNSDSEAAQRILRARKLRLKRILFVSKCDSVELKLSESVLGESTAGINDPVYRKFQCSMEVNNVGAVHLMLLHIIRQFYDVSQATILLRGDGSNNLINNHNLVVTFGDQPNQNDKIGLSVMIVESDEMVHFLRWFCPIRLIISCYPQVLIDEPSLMSGVEVIECSKINADRLMENSKARVIHLQGNSNWTDESIVRVLTAHRLSAHRACPRNITYRYGNRYRTGAGNKPAKDWREFFDSWSRIFEAEHGKTGRDVTLHANGSDYITFTLH